MLLLDRGESFWFCNLLMEQWLLPVTCGMWPVLQTQLPEAIWKQTSYMNFHTAPRCGTEEAIQNVTLHSRDRCRTALLCYKHCAKITVFICEQRPMQYDFHVGVRAIWYYNSCPKGNWRPHLCKIREGKRHALSEFCKWRIERFQKRGQYLSKSIGTKEKKRLHLIRAEFSSYMIGLLDLAVLTWSMFHGFETPNSLLLFLPLGHSSKWLIYSTPCY